MFFDRIIDALNRAASLPAGLFKSAPAGDSLRRDADGAVMNEALVEIAAPAEAVFALLDPSGTGHRWGQRGDRIEAVNRENFLYRLIDQRMPESPFIIRIDAALAPQMISMTVSDESGALIGAIVTTSSSYQITDTTDGCRVSLVERTHFVGGLPKRELANHAFMLGEGVRIDLRRLKEEAEQAAGSPSAIRA